MFDSFPRATIALLTFTCLALSACHSQRSNPIGTSWTGDKGSGTTVACFGKGVDTNTTESSDLASKSAVPGADTIYFEYNSYALTRPAMESLKRYAHAAKSNPELAAITIAGHCDERGTQEYNLALGERRAEAVRKFLAGLGVEPGRISTISYGEELPASGGHDEDAWSKNRRAEFKTAS
jgi:peptidoglycan-associated lipoprotein